MSKYRVSMIDACIARLSPKGPAKGEPAGRGLGDIAIRDVSADAAARNVAASQSRRRTAWKFQRKTAVGSVPGKRRLQP
jgi:hypothetical protein